NFPNPFNPNTTIAFDVAQTENISVVVYDLTGKMINKLVSNIYIPGHYQITWNALDGNGNSVPSGIYVYQLRTSSMVLTRKMVLLR
ncbi:MAG TPA: hypothetical protein DDZ36_10140, partial [Deltaproteobacteria bacterium]|nr:hypothetical protein [Deltaproteobacteria bacterium]